MSSDPAGSAISLIERDLRPLLAAATRKPFMLGICGAQGSGKSTISEGLRDRLSRRGLRTAVLSIDDLYLPAERRAALARVHPLLRTRGVPGTHDLSLAEGLLAVLGGEAKVRLPRFSKALDTRLPESAWDLVDAPLDLLIFEGWCVGAVPQSVEDLVRPVNALEAEQDGDGRWRNWVNEQLAGGYQRLFDRIDRLVLLRAPDFGVVSAWRREQEHRLRETLLAEGADLAETLDDAGVDLFIQHYQRLTEHILAEMPARADLVISLDSQRRPHPERKSHDRRIADTGHQAQRWPVDPPARAGGAPGSQ